MLARRSHGRAEVERKLARTVGDDVVADVVEALARAGLVDDDAHANEVARRRLEQGWGPLRIENDLEVAGVAAASARAALDAIGDEDLLAGARVAVGRRDGPEAVRRLAARGFDEDVATRLGLDVDAGRD